MLREIKSFKGKSASDKDAGDINDFLRSVLVEVAAENYRQSMYEAMALASDSEDKYDLDPPLRANERVMSGLFATAISRVALRSRTEVRIDRPERDSTVDALEGDGGEESGSRTKNGRVDFLAWYGNRVIGIELKMANMNCESPQMGSIARRWKTAVDQAKDVQTCLRSRQQEDSRRYPAPASIALMVIVGKRNISTKSIDDMVNKDTAEMEERSQKALAALDPRPTFMASYTFPSEFRAISLRRNGREASVDGRAMYTPFVWFIAKPAVKSS